MSTCASVNRAHCNPTPTHYVWKVTSCDCGWLKECTDHIHTLHGECVILLIDRLKWFFTTVCTQIWPHKRPPSSLSVCNPSLTDRKKKKKPFAPVFKSSPRIRGMTKRGMTLCLTRGSLSSSEGFSCFCTDLVQHGYFGSFLRGVFVFYEMVQRQVLDVLLCLFAGQL